jgi:hypothetical protein
VSRPGLLMRAWGAFLDALIAGAEWYDRELAGKAHPVKTPGPCRHPVRVGPHCADCGEKVL